MQLNFNGLHFKKHTSISFMKGKKLRLMPSVILAVIAVHTVILLIFIAVASWKMVNLEKAIEKHEPRVRNSMEGKFI